MSASSLYTMHPPASSDVYQQRVDQQRCAVVDRGISVQTSFSTLCAVEYLKSHNVDSEVIERVLLHPEQRRRSDH